MQGGLLFILRLKDIVNNILKEALYYSLMIVIHSFQLHFYSSSTVLFIVKNWVLLYSGK